EATELALPRPPIAERVVQRVHHLLVRGAIGPALVAVVALRAFEDDLALLLRVDGALHPCHETCSPLLLRGRWTWRRARARAAARCDRDRRGRHRPGGRADASGRATSSRGCGS